MGFTADNQSFHNVSLGQGQEVVAEEAMDIGAKNGHWVVLQVRQIILNRAGGSNKMVFRTFIW
jgi:Dynein heavy chain region D6 P-loop domain